jgi:hypothetical protein
LGDLREVKEVGQQQPVFASLATIKAHDFDTRDCQQLLRQVSTRQECLYGMTMAIGRQEGNPGPLWAESPYERFDRLNYVRHLSEGVGLKWPRITPTTSLHFVARFFEELF